MDEVGERQVEVEDNGGNQEVIPVGVPVPTVSPEVTSVPGILPAPVTVPVVPLSPVSQSSPAGLIEGNLKPVPVLPPSNAAIAVPLPVPGVAEVVPVIEPVVAPAPQVSVPVVAIPVPPTPPVAVHPVSDATIPIPAKVDPFVDLGGDDWEDAPVAGVALPFDVNPVDLDNEVPWLGRKLAGSALPQVTLSQVDIVPEYLGEVPQAADPNDIDFDPSDSASGTAEDLKPLKVRPVKKKSHKKIRLTERDMEIMAFLARYRIANVSLLSMRFNTSVSALRNRLPALEREGLLTCSWVTQTKGKVWLITSAGLATVGMNLTAPSVRWGQLRHTLGLTEMGIKFELAGENVLTEREIRAAATRYTPTKRLRTAIDFAATVQALESGDEADPIVERIRTALTVPVPGRGFGHIPDMVLAREPYPNGASGSIAIELELTRKGLSEWKTVLTAYRDSPNFDQVYYLVVSSEIKRGLEGVIKALGAQNKIQVMPIVLNDLTGDPESNGGGGE
jgi:DNA-binding PadR family transcriptional regulator